MAGGSTRPVRIARHGAGFDEPPPPARSEPASGSGPRGLPPLGNPAGLRRARRLLLLYLLALAATFGGLVAMMASSPYAVVRTDSVAYIALSAIAAASALAAYVLTVGRAPWALYVDDGRLVVRERFGAVRRFELGPGFRLEFVARHRRGLLGPEPTETVRLRSARGRVREYVLGAGELEKIPELEGYVALA